MALIAAPLALALAVEPSSRIDSWPRESAVALGFAAFVVLAVQLALVSRVGTLSRAIGLDALLQFHRDMAVVAIIATIGHVVVLASGWRVLNPLHPSPAIGAGAAAFWLLAVISISSFARRQLRLSYEAWQIIHLGCAVLIVGAAIAHAIALGRYSAAPAMRGLLMLYATLFAGLLLRYRVVRPLRLARAPWEVTANEDAGGSTRLVTLRPIGHTGFEFDAGQFAWLTTGRSPLLSQKHPLSIASAPSALTGPRPHVQFAIKALGDWSSSVVPALRAGHRVWIDGPYGAFTPPAGDSPLVLIAGGIGIAPMRSILLAAAARGDRRAITLFYAAADASRLAFAPELEAISTRLALTIVRVFERPPADWTGERGFITADMIRRHAPADADYFVCGPLPMIDAFERIRAELRLPRLRVHTERFQVV